MGNLQDVGNSVDGESHMTPGEANNRALETKALLALVEEVSNNTH